MLEPVKSLALCLLFLNSCSPRRPHQIANFQSTPTNSAEQRVGPSSQTEKSPTPVIRAGQSVGLLKLGDSHQRALDLLGKTEEDYNFEAGEGSCPRSEMHWYDLERDRNGVFVYLKNGRIYQIVAATPRYATPEWIKNGSTPEQVRRYYPDTQSYALLGSGAIVVGGRDIVYWVDSEHGIAFEFYYDSKSRKRSVEGVIVFEPGVEFLPEGCISPPQKWIKLRPFALETGRKG